MDAKDHTVVLNIVIRMVVPMRREFGRSLDVQQFMRDPGYARVVLDEALASRDERLREYAAYVQRHLGGAREVEAPKGNAVPPQGASPAAATAVPGAPVPAAEGGETEAELRARVMKKYTGGLR